MKGGGVITWRRFGAVALCSVLVGPVALAGQAAPGGPGEMPRWTPASKEGIGTSLSTESKVWFTLQGGILTEVYYPRLDVADVHGLEFAVSDGRRVWIESRDMRHALARIDPRALLYRQTSRDAARRFTITQTYATDPQRHSLLIDVTFTGPAGAVLYVLYHPALKKSGFGNIWSGNRGALVGQK